MNHQIVDAINQAFTDEVSRLFAAFCHDTDAGKFVKGMDDAWEARCLAVQEMSKRARLHAAGARVV